MKKLISINYSGSGVSTLKGIGIICVIIGCLAIFAALILFFSEDFDDIVMTLILLISSGVSMIVSGVVARALSLITETALMKKSILLKEYDFAEINEEYTPEE